MQKNRLEAYVLQRAIINQQGYSILASAIGGDWKGKLSPALYFIAIPLAFVSPWIVIGFYAPVSLIWFIPCPPNRTHAGEARRLKCRLMF